LDGLRSVTLRAPLGTYTGWNVRADGFSQGDACDLTGGYIPFAKTVADRQASGDHRLSLQERYGNVTKYRRSRRRLPSALSITATVAGDEGAAVTSAVNQAIQAGLPQ